MKRQYLTKGQREEFTLSELQEEILTHAQFLLRK